MIRHPMPYGDLAAQRVQRFATEADLVRHKVTVEEREEYEPHMATGSVVFAGVDYAAILAAAEQEADVVLWDGGNNDTSFIKADLYFTVVDPHRAGHELTYYPGETNVRLADVIVINKVDTAPAAAVATVRENVRRANPRARIVDAACPVTAEHPEVLARQARARDRRRPDAHPRRDGVRRRGARGARGGRARAGGPAPLRGRGDRGGARAVFPRSGGAPRARLRRASELADLEETIARGVADGVEVVAIGTPIDLAKLVKIPVPAHARELRDRAAGRRDVGRPARSRIVGWPPQNVPSGARRLRWLRAGPMRSHRAGACVAVVCRLLA